MTKIQLTVTGARASAQVDGPITAGMVGIPVEISCDSAWDGLTKTLVCKSDAGIRVVLNAGNQACVAPEVLRWDKNCRNGLFLGVEGRNSQGTLVIPSTFAYCGDILPGAESGGDPSVGPEEPAWAKILSGIGDLNDLETPDARNLVAAINSAAKSGGQGGKSAYSYAVEGGFSGSEGDFAQKLASALVVTLTTIVGSNGHSLSTWETDTTLDQVVNAIAIGRVVYAKYEGCLYSCLTSDLSSKEIYFGYRQSEIVSSELESHTLLIHMSAGLNSSCAEVIESDEVISALPSPSALTIHGQTYDGSTAVDLTQAINDLIDAKLEGIENGTY